MAIGLGMRAGLITAGPAQIILRGRPAAGLSLRSERGGRPVAHISGAPGCGLLRPEIYNKGVEQIWNPASSSLLARCGVIFDTPYVG